MSLGSQPLLVGEWRLEPELDELRREAAVVKLEPRATRFLCCLAERPGELFTIEELMDRVWPGLVVGTNSVYQIVGQLRRAFGDVGEEPKYIATVPRRGYRLVAPVTRITPEAAHPAPAMPAMPAAAEAVTATLPPAPSPRQRWRPPAVALALATVLLIALLASGIWFVGRGGAATAHAAAPAVAVLPFADLSADGSSTQFCEGLTDEVINSLGRVRGLRVTGRTSVYALTERRVDPGEIGKRLGVTHVLLGSVRPAEGRVRISARLVNASDGFQVWANSYDRELKGAVAVQTEIARAVVDSLSLRLTAAEQAEVGRPPTPELNAYDLYLLGRYQQLQRTPDSLERAIGYHGQAVRADPRFALAHAGLADAYMARFYYSNQSLADTEPLVEEQVNAALALDAELPEAYAARAVLRIEQRRSDEAIADLQRAIAINPNVGEFYQRLGSAYEYAGRPRDALATYDQVESLDPLHTQLHVRRCIVLRTLGRFEEADAACQRGFELQPGIPNALWARAVNAYVQGRLDDAARYYEQALERAPHRADIRTELGIVQLDRGLADLAIRAFSMASEDAGAWSNAIRVEALTVSLARGEVDALRRELRSADWLENAGARELLRAGNLALAVGDAPLAEQLRARAVASAGFSEEALTPSGYDVCWGRCALCALALLERARGDVTAADRHTQRFLQWFQRAIDAGSASNAMYHFRAALLAQAGDKAAAIADLEHAAARGWHRAWLVERDPSFAPLRGERAFEEVLRQLRSTAPTTSASVSAG